MLFSISTLVCSAFLFCSIVASAQQTVTGKVHGIGPVTCNWYLHLPPKPRVGMPLIVLQVGSGLYSTMRLEGIHPVAEEMRRSNSAAILTINKPGIKSIAVEKNFDERQYLLHTVKDLSECNRQAVKIAASRTSFQNSLLIFLGHSEGAEVLTRTLNSLRTDPIIARIQGIVLSGTPVDYIVDILKFQFDKKWLAQFWDMYRARNEIALAQQTGVGLRYWDDILNTEPLAATLMHMGRAGVKVPFYLYHGTNDKHTPARSIRILEEKNKHASQGTSLPLTVRYFDAEHTLNKTALLEMLGLIQDLVGRSQGPISQPANNFCCPSANHFDFWRSLST